MRAFAVIIVALLLAAAFVKGEAPVYSAASVVNAADNQSGALAPNTLATIYGKNLAFATRALSANDVQSGSLPTVLAGVRILVGNILANPIYVSPNQINFLVPPNLIPAAMNLQVVVDSSAGPSIPIQLAAAAPALFQLDAQNAIATRADGSLITPDAPAKPGDIVVLYATGLGQTIPPATYNLLPTEAAALTATDFTVSLDGVAVDRSAILYAGVAPDFAGLYQINLTLPASTGANPHICIGFPDSLSPSSVTLPVQP